MFNPPGVNDVWRTESVDCEADLDAVDGHGNEMAAECDFSGDVDVCVGDGLKTWECPQCFAAHEESWEPEDDIDPDTAPGGHDWDRN